MKGIVFVDTYAYVQKGGVLEFEPVLPDEMVLPVTKSEGVPVSPSDLADSVKRFISEGDTHSIPDGVQVLVIARDGNPNHTEAHAVVDDGAVSSYGSLKTN